MVRVVVWWEVLLVRRRVFMGRELLPQLWEVRGLSAQVAVIRLVCLGVSQLFVKVLGLRSGKVGVGS